VSEPLIDNFMRKSRMAAGPLLLVGAAFAFINTEQFFRSYLFAYMFVLGLSLGSLAILLIYHLSGGRWGAVIRSLLEASIRIIPFLAILFIPIAIGMKHLYIWTDTAHVQADHVLQQKSAYLNTGFFLVRALICFAVWSLLSLRLNRLSDQQAKDPTPEVQSKLQFTGGIGLVLYGLTMTFASVDWVMSLDPHWFSTIFGLLLIAGQVLSAFALMITAASFLRNTKPFGDIISPLQYHDLGKLMLAFVMIWAYLQVSQFLIMWSGNLPEEIPWYLRRSQGGWQAVSTALVLLHFALPFLLLLSKGRKQNPRSLAPVAIGILVMRVVDLFWMIGPEFQRETLHFHLLVVVLPVGMIALWLTLFAMQLNKRPLVPVNDPNLPEGEFKLNEAH
jgi:hypothetical protein